MENELTEWYWTIRELNSRSSQAVADARKEVEALYKKENDKYREELHELR